MVSKISKISIFCFSGFGFFRSKKHIKNAGIIGAVSKQGTFLVKTKTAPIKKQNLLCFQ